MKNSDSFTEGPWHVDSGMVVDKYGNVVAIRRSMEVMDPESGKISRCCSGTGVPHISPVEADNNCHLLATAPELLEALEAAVVLLHASYLDHENTDNGNVIFEGLEKAREAVAKARRDES